MDEGFTDPVLRCDSCQVLIRRETLRKIGSCHKCGNKRVRNVNVFSPEERDQIEEWGYLSFLDEFEGVADA